MSAAVVPSPLRGTWHRVKDHPQCCLRWKMSYWAFIRDVGKPPYRRIPLELIHLDTLQELGPGNAAWMDRVHAIPHMRYEEHRRLMAEIHHPVPPYVAPTAYADPPCSQAYVIPTDCEVRLEAFREEIKEMRERRARPLSEIPRTVLDLQVIYKCQLMGVRRRIRLSELSKKKFLKAYPSIGSVEATIAHLKTVARNTKLRQREAQERALKIAKQAEAQRQWEAEAPARAAAEAACRARCEAEDRQRQYEYDLAHPRWMALKIVPAVFDGKAFASSPFEMVNEAAIEADRVLAMLKVGARQGWVKVMSQEGTSCAQFGIVQRSHTDWAHTNDYIVAVRGGGSYQLRVVREHAFKTFVVDN